MVLDCGGGTIDITSHLVESSDPLQLSEVAEPCGGAWGSSIVDARFRAFLQVLHLDFGTCTVPGTTLKCNHCTTSAVLYYSITTLLPCIAVMV